MRTISKANISKFLIFSFLLFILVNPQYPASGNEKSGLNLIRNAEKLYLNHSFQKAIDTYNEALKLVSKKKNLARLYLGLSKSYYALGFITTTKEILKKMVNLNIKQKFQKDKFPREYLKLLESTTPDIIQNKPEIKKEEKTTVHKSNKNVIEKIGEKKRKKKFPILLIAGGVVIIGILAAVLSKKKSTNKKYTLNVSVGNGINGTPSAGSISYDEGASVNYEYSLQNGFNNLVVQLDGVNVDNSGTITMNRDHNLSVTASESDDSKAYLTVTVGEGVLGSPSTGVRSYDIGKTASYSYSLMDGYSDLEVRLDGNIVSNSGTITMHSDHTLTSSTSTSGDSGPSVSITSPSNGSTVDSTVSINVNASSDSGINYVECRIDGGSIGTDSTQPYSISWDTTGYSEGSHNIKVLAYDNSSKSASKTISVTVDNYTQNPTITITAPANTQTISGSFLITADGTDDLAIDYMVFLMDGNAFRESMHGHGGTSMGYVSDLINSTQWSNGSHTLKGRIYDMEGNVGEHTITININN